MVNKARTRLENHGMKLVVAVPPAGDGKPWGAREVKAGDKPADMYLAIANKHEALARLFKDQRWASGVWSQTFARVRLTDDDGNVIAEAKRRVQVRMAKKSTKATLVPIAALLDAEEGAR
jgi:spore germination protein YaaH